MRRLASTLLLAGFVCVIAAPVAAQARIEYVHAQRVMPPHGPDLFRHYCAACHGPAAQGDGAAARALKTPVPDLTLIGVRDNGFDPVHVAAHVRGAYAVDPMPEWHQVLRATYNSDKMEQLVVRNLVEYLQGIQVKP